MALLGVEIGGTKLQVAAVSPAGAVHEARGAAVDPSAGAAAVLESLAGLLADHAIQRHGPFEAVGVGFGGPVDRVAGTVAACHQVAGWSGCPLGAWITGRTGLPAVIENDTNVAALAEAIRGAGRGHDSVVYSNAGSGVGGGWVRGGRMHHGRLPGEMELGHLRLSLDGPTVEEAVSGWSLDRQVAAAVGRHPDGILASMASGATPSARLLGPAVAAGDPVAATILGQAARAYALGLSHVVHLLNPDVIVLGGGVATIGEPWRTAVAAHLEGFVVPALRPAPPVRLAMLGDLVVPVGAALAAKGIASA